MLEDDIAPVAALSELNLRGARSTWCLPHERHRPDPTDPRGVSISDPATRSPAETPTQSPIRDQVARVRFEDGPKTWVTTSWRTRLRQGGPNRRFYNLDGHPWLVDPVVALDLLTRFESIGGLDAGYASNSEARQEIVTSDGLDPKVRRRLLEEITGPAESWSDGCSFVIAQDPGRPNGNLWRKIMLLDPEHGRATFRSTTLHPTYMPRAELRPGLTWVLDNSMQDADVTETQAFLAELRRRL